MELPDWLTNLLIILALIVIVGLIIAKYYPEPFNKTITIFDEVFGISKDKKLAENLTETIFELKSSIKACLKDKTGLSSCACNLNLKKLPEGYYIKIQNTADGIAIAAFTSDFSKVSDTLTIQGLKVSLAETKDLGDITTESCNQQDITITKQDDIAGVIVNNKFYPFINEEMTEIPISILNDNILCFYSKKLYVSDEHNRAEYFLNEILPSYSCDKQMQRYALTWPTAPQNILEVKDCLKQYDNAIGIMLNVKHGSKIINPFNGPAIVKNKCVKDCKNLTLYEAYNTGKPTGRFVKINGIYNVEPIVSSALDKNNLIKPEDVLGSSGHEIEYIIGFDDTLTKEKIKPEDVYCELPLLSSKYSNNCQDYLHSCPTNVYKNLRFKWLMQTLQNLNDNEKGKFSLISTYKLINVVPTYKLINNVIGNTDRLLGFSKNQKEIKRGFLRTNTKRPELCPMEQSCLCYCDTITCQNPETSICKSFDENGFSPSFIKGPDYDNGIIVDSKELFMPVYYKRRGKILYLCSEEDKKLCL